MSRIASLGSARVGYVFGALLAVSLWGCQGSSGQRTPLDQGRRVFARTCAGCHGGDGSGTTTRMGFSTPPKDLRDPALHERLGREGIKRAIQVGQGQMPAFGALMGEEDIDALVVYVESLKR